MLLSKKLGLVLGLGLGCGLNLAQAKAPVAVAVEGLESVSRLFQTDTAAQEALISTVNKNPQMKAAAARTLKSAPNAEAPLTKANINDLLTSLKASSLPTDLNLSLAIVGLSNAIRAQRPSEEISSMSMNNFMKLADMPSAEAVDLKSGRSDQNLRIELSLSKKLSKAGMDRSQIDQVMAGVRKFGDGLLGPKAEECLAGTSSDAGFQGVGLQVSADGLAAAGKAVQLTDAKSKASAAILAAMKKLYPTVSESEIRSRVCNGLINGDCQVFKLASLCQAAL